MRAVDVNATIGPEGATITLPRLSVIVETAQARRLRDALNAVLPERIEDLLHDPRVTDLHVLQAAQALLAERGQDTESLAVAIDAIENPRCTLCGCRATEERYGFKVCDYHLDHTEDDPQCPNCMTADEEQPRDGRQTLRELRQPAPVLTDSRGLHYCHACTEQAGEAWGFHDEHPDASDEWWCDSCECGLTPAAWKREANGRQIKRGDRVRDPHGGAWRTVARVVNTTVRMTDGGTMSVDDCRDVRLPGEAES